MTPTAVGVRGQARLGMSPILVAAMVIDAVGSGLTAPFILIVGHVLASLSLPVTGLAAAIGAAVGIAGGPLAGSAVDRFGPARVVVAANLICAVGNVGLLFAHDAVTFGAASGVCAFAVRAFYSALSPLISSMAAPEHRERWFGWVRGARNIGLTTGGVLASVAMLAGERTGLRIILAGDAATYVVAGTMVMAAVRSSHPTAARRDRATSTTGYGTALADRGNVVLALLNVCCTVFATVPPLALPLYVLGRFPRMLWLPGALSAVMSMVLALLVTVAPRLSRKRRRLCILALSTSLWAMSSMIFALAGPAPATVGIVLLFVAASVFGLADAVYSPTADALPLFLAPPGHAGRYTALHQLAWGVSSVVSPILASSLSAVTPYVVWVVLAALALLAALTYLALGPTLGHRAGRAGATEHDRPRAARDASVA